MSFGRLRRTALDSEAPIAWRHRALGCAISSYSSLTNTSFTSVLAQLRGRHALGALDGGRVGDAFTELEAARSRYLLVHFAFGELRRGQKRRGIRRPPRPDVRELEDVVSLGSLRSRIQR